MTSGEHRLDHLPLAELLARIADKTPAPGGGAVAASTGAHAAALAHMVVSYSLGKKSLGDHQTALAEAASSLARARSLFLELAAEDAEAYEDFTRLSRLPEGDPARSDLDFAKAACVQAPLAALAAAADLSRLIADLAPITNRALLSDLVIAAHLAHAAAVGARWNVLINLPMIQSDRQRERTRSESARLLSETAERAAEIDRFGLETLGLSNAESTTGT